jgi:hypothetical protein
MVPLSCRFSPARRYLKRYAGPAPDGHEQHGGEFRGRIRRLANRGDSRRHYRQIGDGPGRHLGRPCSR